MDACTSNCSSQIPRRWRKVTYGGMQAGFDDNHTDETFLEDMVMNANVVKRDILKVMQDSVPISQYLCIVSLVLLVWTYTLTSTLDKNSLLLLDASLLGSGFLILVLTEEMLSINLLSHYILNITFFITGLYVLARIYQTLTRSISSDSIWVVTIALLILHLFLHDYSTKSNLNQLYLFTCICCSFCFHCIPPSIKASCLCHHAVLLAGLPFCSTGHLLCKEILLPLAPSILLRLDGCDLVFCLYAAQVTFCVGVGTTGFN